jgi:hypothetical protein
LPQTQQPAGTNPFGSASVDDPLGLYSDSSAQRMHVQHTCVRPFWGCANFDPNTTLVATSNVVASFYVRCDLGAESSLYEREAAYAQHIGEDGHHAIVARQQDFSELGMPGQAP